MERPVVWNVGLLELQPRSGYKVSSGSHQSLPAAPPSQEMEITLQPLEITKQGSHSWLGSDKFLGDQASDPFIRPLDITLLQKRSLAYRNSKQEMDHRKRRAVTVQWSDLSLIRRQLARVRNEKLYVWSRYQANGNIVCLQGTSKGLLYKSSNIFLGQLQTVEPQTTCDNLRALHFLDPWLVNTFLFS